MKAHYPLIIALCLGLGASPSDAAPGGGRRPGGGGGHVGGGFSPSRPSPGPRPAPRPSPGPRPGTAPRPPGGEGPRPPRVGGGGPGPIRPTPSHPIGTPGGRPGAGDIGKHLGRPPQGHFPGTPGHRPGYGGYHKAEFHQNIYNHFPYHPTYGHPFSHAWCGHFNWHYNHWPYWTAAATGVALAHWVGVGTYTGYESSEQVVYYPVEQAPQEVYAQSVTAPAQAVEVGTKAAVGNDSEWMNIGTFGIIPYKATDFAYAVQLASTKDGILRGIQWDMKANTQVEVTGSIQKDTMRVAWQAKDGTLMFETNVANLTEAESMVNVYDTKTKGLVSWQLIQIDEKDLPPPPK